MTATPWTPLPLLAHARVVHPWHVPAAPQQKESLFVDLAIGDELYIFEEDPTKKWGRAYVLTQPAPSFFLTAVDISTDLSVRKNSQKPKSKKSVGTKMKITLAIVPLDHVHIFESVGKPLIDPSNLNMLKAKSHASTVSNATISDQSSSASTDTIMNSVLDNEKFDSFPPTTNTIPHSNSNQMIIQNFQKPNRPVIPGLKVDDDKKLSHEPLVDEIRSAIKDWSENYVYKFYLDGEYTPFNKLVDIINELRTIGAQLLHNLFTIYELDVARKKCVWLLNYGVKIINNTLPYENKPIIARDPSIDIGKGKMLDYSDSPFKISIQQERMALFQNYPSVLKFEQQDKNYLPCHILVDVKDVQNKNSKLNIDGDRKEMIGLTAYLHLRNKKKILTESFAVNINPEGFFVQDISAALFKNIPSCEYEKDRIYLVAILTEEIHVLPKNLQIKINEKGIQEKPKSKRLKRGIAAGVADICRVFRQNEGSENEFVIKMFGSYLGVNDPSPDNKGWGDLVDRIVLGLSKGVGFDPRAEQIIVSVKKFTATPKDAKEDSEFKPDTTMPIKSIRSLFYEPIIDQDDQIYLNINSVLPIGHPSILNPPILPSPEITPTNSSKKNKAAANAAAAALLAAQEQLKIQKSIVEKNEYLTVQFASGTGFSKFANATQANPTATWETVSVVAGECIGEVIRVHGLLKSRKNKEISEKGEEIYINLFVRGSYVGQGKFLLWKNETIFNVDKKKQVEIYGKNNEGIIAYIELTIEYVGKNFNIDNTVKKLIGWKNLLKQSSSTKNGINELLKVLNSSTYIDLSQFLKYFKDLIKAHCEIMSDDQLSKYEDIKLSNFHALTHMFDVVLIRQSYFGYIMEDFLNTPFIGLPKKNVASTLLEIMEHVASTLSTDRSRNGRAFCRVFAYLIRLVVKCTESYPSKENTEIIYKSLLNLTEKLEFFFQTKINDSTNDDDLLVPGGNGNGNPNINTSEMTGDQINLIDTLFDWFKHLKLILNNEQILNLVIKLVQSMNANFDSIFKKKKLIISRLLLIQKLVGCWLFKDKKCRIKLTRYSSEWCKQVVNRVMDKKGYIQNEMQLTGEVEELRLSNSIFASIANQIFQILKESSSSSSDNNTTTTSIPSSSLLELINETLPWFQFTCQLINEVDKKLSIERAGHLYYFVKRRTYTDLFPSEYPITSYPLDSAVNEESFSEVMVELATCFIASVRLTKFSNVNVLKFNKQQIKQIIKSGFILLKSNSFPKRWVSLYSSIIESVVTSLELLLPVMIKNHIPDSDDEGMFETQLWYNYLNNILICGSSPYIEIELLDELSRKAVWRLTNGDLRSRISDLLSEAWNALSWDSLEEDRQHFEIDRFGGYQVEFVSGDKSILGKVLSLCIQRQNKIQQCGVNILWSIMVSEWTLTESLAEIERDCLLALMKLYGKLTVLPDQYDKDRFIMKLKNTVRMNSMTPAYTAFRDFIDALNGFLDELHDIYSVPQGDNRFRDDIIFHKLILLYYFAERERLDLFAEYIHELVEENLSRNTGYSQAALALGLLAKGYEWSFDIILEPMEKPPFPRQTAFERKEALLKLMCDYFTRGKAYHKAIEVYKELAKAYEMVSFELNKLSATLKDLAGLYEIIENAQIPSPTYFRVAYIGTGFPRSLRNKQYIFEGLPFERLASIHDRLLKLHPGAKIISHYKENDSEKADGMFLYVSTVYPKIDIFGPVYTLKHTTRGGQNFVNQQHMNLFTFTRPLPGSTGVVDLWVEETTYQTFDTFPTIVNRSEIETEEVIKKSPLENANDSIVAKTNELVTLENVFKTSDSSFGGGSLITELSRNLTGTIDSPVNGGVQQYRVFLNDQTLLDDPQKARQVISLRESFVDLMQTIDRLLAIHAKVIPVSLRPAHESMVEMFKKNFSWVREELMSPSINSGSLGTSGSIANNSSKGQLRQY